jgi:hypothetical protein
VGRKGTPIFQTVLPGGVKTMIKAHCEMGRLVTAIHGVYKCCCVCVAVSGLLMESLNLT